MGKRHEQEQFILGWLKANEPFGINVLNGEFHDAFHAEFGGAFLPYPWGCRPVLKAMRLLETMCKQGVLVRWIQTKKDMRLEPDFPNWWYVYQLPTTKFGNKSNG